jgi:hypothetical protein
MENGRRPEEETPESVSPVGTPGRRLRLIDPPGNVALAAVRPHHDAWVRSDDMMLREPAGSRCMESKA